MQSNRYQVQTLAKDLRPCAINDLRTVILQEIPSTPHRSYIWRSGRLDGFSVGGNPNVDVESINNRDEMIALVVDENGKGHRLLLSELRTIDLAGLVGITREVAINDVNGLAASPSEEIRRNANFVRYKSQITVHDLEEHSQYSLPNPCGYQSDCTGLNNSFDVCGTLKTPETHVESTDPEVDLLPSLQLLTEGKELCTYPALWLYSDGEWKCQLLSEQEGNSRAINEHRVVVGFRWEQNSGTRTACAWSPQTGEINLETLGGASSVADSLNDSGLIVGWSMIDETQTTHAFVAKEEMVDLNDLIPDSAEIWLLTKAVDVNNHGEIVAEAIERNSGDRYAVMLVPEN